MKFDLTNVFSRNKKAVFDPSKRTIINEGGTSSSKTYSIIQFLVYFLSTRQKPFLQSIVSESLPHLKMGCIRDFKNIMGDDFEDTRWNASNNIYNFNRNVILEFFSADQPGKASGPRRDGLYINEVNNVPKVIVDQLSVRTRRFEIYDFNPVSEFWVHALQGKPEVEWIHSTYLDAKHVLPKSIIEKIEAKRDTDPNWWRVYGLGLVGKLDGLVHPMFSQDEYPNPGLCEMGREAFGLDFGFSDDPACLTRNVILGGELYSDELIYERGLLACQIAKRMEGIGVKKNYDEIWADSARPEAIEEIKQYGFNVKPVEKGPGSIEDGIDKVNSYRQHWTPRSVNCIKEQRNYNYIVDKDGRVTGKPIDDFNHGMDSRRYAVRMMCKRERIIEINAVVSAPTFSRY
jgi:phage terminase large subunit